MNNLLVFKIAAYKRIAGVWASALQVFEFTDYSTPL